ncbi:MAG: FAD-dependent oxidoreductase [Candidatus Bathyarchaeum sp.]|nr:MAG: FAD-dependent oxidoreductase [Candidatus Bathyarchaeum sp.]
MARRSHQTCREKQAHRSIDSQLLRWVSTKKFYSKKDGKNMLVPTSAQKLKIITDKLQKSEKTLSLETVLNKILDFEKLKNCYGCGICTASCPVAKLLPEHYNPRTLLQSLPTGDEKILKSAELWLCAWCYRCYRRCPQSLNLPEIFQALRRFAVECGYMEGFHKALEIVRDRLPLLGSCCYVGFHPERVITNKQLIKEAIQHTIFTYKAVKRKAQPITPAYRDKVAIIGSGPAGLSAAHDLAKKGYSVTIFEALSSAGGMLRRCIPEYRLPKKIVDFDIMCIKDLGVEIKTNMAIGGNLKVNKLLEGGYDAIFVATGAHEEQNGRIEGEELNGVFHALEFLEKANMKEVELPNKVSIIGGGNVAVDSARTALRLGAKEATILYRRSKGEMPASPWEIKEAEEEGVKIEFLVAPKRILGENDKVTAIECAQMELGKPDATGRRHPVPIQGSDFVIKTDSVIIAIGQFPNTGFLPEIIEITKQRTIATDPFTLETSSPSIFAGGDAVLGSGTLMEAILAGKQAAFSIDCYLKGVTLGPLKFAERTFGGRK